jgi:hypothetical protein
MQVTNERRWPTRQLARVRRTPRRPRVVVGVGESPASRRALAWAYDLCARRGWVLDVVTAWPDLHEAPVHEVPGHYCVPRGRAMTALHAALEECGVAADGRMVQVHLENADPVQALVEHSHGAVLLVVGETDAGRSRHAGCEPVARACRRRAACAVRVVPDEDPATLRTG